MAVDEVLERHWERSVEGRTRRRSQWVFWERRGVRGVFVGGIVQRMTRETVRGG